MPVYDFTAHTRSEKTIHTEPADIIILEGILVLGEENLRNLLRHQVFVDTDDDISFYQKIRTTRKNVDVQFIQLLINT